MVLQQTKTTRNIVSQAVRDLRHAYEENDQAFAYRTSRNQNNCAISNRSATRGSGTWARDSGGTQGTTLSVSNPAMVVVGEVSGLSRQTGQIATVTVARRQSLPVVRLTFFSPGRIERAHTQGSNPLNFLPKDEKFFDYFHQQSTILCQASSLLLSGLQGGYQSMCQISKRMEAFERSGDEITHRLFERLRQTFITPFDPEDIQSLATALDDVVDTIEDAAFRIVAYRIDPIPAPAVELGEMIANSCRALASALVALQEKRSVMEDCIEVNRLEEQADAVERTMLTDLFSSGIDAVSLIKLKDLYDLLESTTDRCEDVADVIQNIAVKNL